VRATLDNNILISALWSAQGHPAQILAAYRAGRFSLITSEPILAEMERVLQYDRIRERIPAAQGAILLELLRGGAEVVEITGTLQICSDPKDDIFIETALAGSVDLLVTGDKHLHEATVVEHLAAAGVEVIRPADFVRTLQQLQPAQTGHLFTDWTIEP
jgi:putative PIN family toxin of toxin-antitoxin system